MIFMVEISSSHRNLEVRSSLKYISENYRAELFPAICSSSKATSTTASLDSQPWRIRNVKHQENPDYTLI
jgi:hypothetical protein